MPQDNALSPKLSPKRVANKALNRRTSNGQSSLTHHLESSSKTANHASKRPCVGGLGLSSVNKGRRASSSSLSSMQSLSGSADLCDDDEEEDEPAVDAPSYGGRRDTAHKTGQKSTKSQTTVDSDADDSSDESCIMDSDADDSTDDAYAAVDDIPDDDDEDNDVEKLEELLIVESEDEHCRGTFSTALEVASAEGWVGSAALGGDYMMVLSGASFFDNEPIGDTLEPVAAADLTSEAAIGSSMPRRVHFEDLDSTSDSGSASEDEIPSDFLHQDSLDPLFRRMIEIDHDDNRWSHHRYSEDIYGEFDYGHANIYHVESDAESEKSSDYETDDGETTDEDLPPPATITHPRSILRRDSTASLVIAADENIKRTAPSRRRGPVMGTFIADPSKPVALVDSTGKHLVIIPAYASSRHDWLDSASNSICGTVNNSPKATTMQLVDESDSETLVSPKQAASSPMLSSSANLMMAALGNDAASGGQVMGPPEAFYPSRDFTIDSSFEEEEDDDDDPEASLNVEDFINFGDGSSDDEDMSKAFEDDMLASPMVASSVREAGTPTPNRAQDSTQASSAERFLNHLDRGIVTAFRRNHNRYQALLRLPHHREFVPANSPSRPASAFRHSRHTNLSSSRKRKPGRYAGGDAVRRKLMDTQRRTQLPF